MQTKTKHSEKFVNYNDMNLKAPRWEVIRVNNEFSHEQMAKEKAKPVEYQNPNLIAHHRQAIHKRKQELKRIAEEIEEM